MSKLDEIVVQKIIETIKDTKAKNICDYGCGNGSFLQEIETEFKSELELTGIDYFSKMCEDNKPKPLNSKIKFIDKDFMDKSDDFEGYDLIFSTFALHHFKLPITELKKMHSLLKENGVLLIIDFNFKSKSNSQVVKNIVSLVDETLFAIKNGYHRHHYTLDEAKDLFGGLNFKIIESVEFDYIESEEEQELIYKDFMDRNERKTSGVMKNAPEIYKEIFGDLFKLERKLVEKYKLEFNQLISIKAKKG